jgi:hypothetical protein
MMMDSWMFSVIWFGSALLGGVLIYFKQKRFLADVQPIGFLFCGPLTLLLAIILPASMFTSREKSEGRRGSNG